MTTWEPVDGRSGFRSTADSSPGRVPPTAKTSGTARTEPATLSSGPRPAAYLAISHLALLDTDTPDGVATTRWHLERPLLSGLSVPTGRRLTPAPISVNGGRTADGERNQREDGAGEGP